MLNSNVLFNTNMTTNIKFVQGWELIKYILLHQIFTHFFNLHYIRVFFLGVKYYDTKVDSPDQQLTWVFGSGEFSPAVEEALLGAIYLFIL